MKNKRVIQRHHISYEPEEVVDITKGEHFILTRMQWLKKPSQGFIKALKVYIALNEDRADKVIYVPRTTKKSVKG